MSKARKIVFIILKVLYFVVAFAVGMILAVTLPSTVFYDDAVKAVNHALSENDFSTALKISCAWSDKTPVYESRFDDSGIAIFAAASVESDEQKLYMSYVGYMYNVRSSYDVTLSSEANQTKIQIYSQDDKLYTYQLLDYDSTLDGIKDTISSFQHYNFVYFEIRPENLTSVKRMVFVDREGNVFKEFEDMNLSYSEAFFTDVNPYILEYNRDSKSKELSTIGQRIADSSENYQFRDYGSIYKHSMITASIYVLIYFIVIYILADFLVGKRWILGLFKKLIRKIKKKNPNAVASSKLTSDEVYGKDYYTMLTIKLDPVDKEMVNTAKITYSNDTDKTSLEFILSKDKGYSQTQRIHAGVYMNAWFECNDYEATNLPLVLEVRGYKMEVAITLKKK